MRQALAPCLAVRPEVGDDDRFMGQRGDPLQTEAVRLIVRTHAERAGLRGVTPHILRHSVATQMLDAGEDLATVSRLLGPAHLATTAIYTESTVHDLEETVRRLVYDP